MIPISWFTWFNDSQEFRTVDTKPKQKHFGCTVEIFLHKDVELTYSKYWATIVNIWSNNFNVSLCNMSKHCIQTVFLCLSQWDVANFSRNWLQGVDSTMRTVTLYVGKYSWVDMMLYLTTLQYTFICRLSSEQPNGLDSSPYKKSRMHIKNFWHAAPWRQLLWTSSQSTDEYLLIDFKITVFHMFCILFFNGS